MSTSHSCSTSLILLVRFPPGNYITSALLITAQCFCFRSISIIIPTWNPCLSYPQVMCFSCPSERVLVIICDLVFSCVAKINIKERGAAVNTHKPLSCRFVVHFCIQSSCSNWRVEVLSQRPSGESILPTSGFEPTTFCTQTQSTYLQSDTPAL